MGVLALKWSFFRSAFPFLNPFAGSQPYYMSFSDWQYAFVNGMPLDQQRAAYDAQAVPESRVLGRGALWLDARIDFQRERPPLLIVAGENDHIIPAALNRVNFRRYRKSPSITEYKEFAGRNHYTIAAPGWEEVADFALSWAEQKQEATEAPALRRAV
jgi:pimeloyl-ACP methyl ester carboxylesterase